jgi:hypothetical protein
MLMVQAYPQYAQRRGGFTPANTGASAFGGSGFVSLADGGAAAGGYSAPVSLQPMQASGAGAASL